MGAWVYLGNSITAEEPGEAEPSWSLSQSLESDEPGEEGGGGGTLPAQWGVEEI